VRSPVFTADGLAADGMWQCAHDTGFVRMPLSLDDMITINISSVFFITYWPLHDILCTKSTLETMMK
jgi:hypothetical protein